MRRTIIVGNWKMNMTITEAAVLVDDIKKKLKSDFPADIILAPPFTALSATKDLLTNTGIELAGQNIYPEFCGPFTGEISAAMLKDAGCAFVILGHSERRQLFGENDLLINKKIKTSLAHNLKVIFCLGETLEEREQDKTSEVVSYQLKKGLKNLTATEMENIIIAYEPVWAIGTGKNATPEQAQEIHIFIRNNLNNAFGKKTGSATHILYGGSVKPENISDLMNQSDIDGALVGGASLIADSFYAIINSIKPSGSE